MAAISKQVSIVIVNWNSGDILNRCLQALDNSTLIPDKIIIFDNDSSDDSIDRIIEVKNLKLEVIRNKENLGFASANNIAIKKYTESEYVVTLNSDAFPDEFWLERLVSYANKNPQCASLSSLQIDYCQPNIIDGIGDNYHFSGMVGRRGHKKLVIDPEYRKGHVHEVFSACAGAALYRRDVFLEVGGFDGDFFCFVEDVDLGYRFRLSGYDCHCVMDAIVYHIGGASSGGHHSDLSVYYGHRNLEWAYFKNMPFFFLVLSLPFHLILILLEFIIFAKKGKVKIIYKSKLDAIKNIGQFWEKRKKIQRNRKIGSVALFRHLSFFSLH